MKEDTIDGGSRSNKSSETHFSETVKHVASKEDVETTSCYWSDLSLSNHNSCIIIWPFLHFIAVCELWAVVLVLIKHHLILRWPRLLLLSCEQRGGRLSTATGINRLWVCITAGSQALSDRLCMI